MKPSIYAVMVTVMTLMSAFFTKAQADEKAPVLAFAVTIENPATDKPGISFEFDARVKTAAKRTQVKPVNENEREGQELRLLGEKGDVLSVITVTWTKATAPVTAVKVKVATSELLRLKVFRDGYAPRKDGKKLETFDFEAGEFEVELFIQ